MDTTAIVVTYNSADTIGALLDTALPQVDRMIVVDNASTDGTTQILRRYPGLEIVANRTNVGFAAAVNHAIMLSANSDVLLLNPDVECPPGSVGALRDTAAQLGDRFIVVPRLLNDDGSTQDSARTFPTVASLMSRRTALGRSAMGQRIQAQHIAASSSVNRSYVEWAIGAAMFVPAPIISDIGGMDGRFFLYCEDVDWCIRAWRAGHGVVYEPQACMHHHYMRHSKTTFAFNNPATRHHWASLVRLGVKHPSTILFGKTPVSVDLLPV